MTLLGVAGLGLGISFTGMRKNLTSSVTGRHAADISGLFNTTTRVGGVIGVAVFGTAYFGVVHPGVSAATRGFAIINLALAATALAAAAAASISVRRSGRVRERQKCGDRQSADTGLGELEQVVHVPGDLDS